MQTIRNFDDIQTLIDRHERLLLTTYRGIWCPFCRQYLKELSAAFRPDEGLSIYGISVDDEADNQKLRRKLKLHFDILADPNLVMRDHFGVKTGKGHGKEAYLQPALFLFQKQQPVFQWIQTPKMLNLGGAVSRFPVKKLVQEVQRLGS